ncbi:electron transporter RnfE [Thiohalorhabdus denitrificans]|uniref:Putative membrane protein n=1 Tax=Thiohalorhabdus denitrificans TaxID=381306 RepID=A0A0P9C3T5_9GAMM|nr:SHOCT domain-containing protein [Thiohalorhabdus denitrificans]KPV39641.1 electron transporter RnfE [Thiohalorhabdus denitrificans]SCX95839.1 putative membrane protein [Thiohalorhabdus denitrificans]
MYGHDGFWMWGVGGIFMILFWILVILGIAALVRWLAVSNGGRPRNEERSHRALEVLEERYARGEIDREEYLQKKEDLNA